MHEDSDGRGGVWTLHGLRAGRVFAVSGDLISELDVTVAAGDDVAGLGGALDGDDVVVGQGPVQRGHDDRLDGGDGVDDQVQGGKHVEALLAGSGGSGCSP